jgi:hypothetical protein
MRFLTHSRSRRYRRNPAALKAIMSKDNAMNIGGVAVGFLVGAKTAKTIYGFVPANFRKFGGLLGFALGTVAAGFVKNPIAKKVAAGFAASGIYDLVAQNVKTAQGPFVAPLGDTISMGDDDALVGDDVDPRMDGDTINMSGDMTELVGDDGDNAVYG